MLFHKATQIAVVQGTSLGFAHLWWWRSWSKASSGSYASPHPNISNSQGLFFPLKKSYQCCKNWGKWTKQNSRSIKTHQIQLWPVMASWSVLQPLGFYNWLSTQWIQVKFHGAASSMSSSNICLARSRTPPLGPRASSAVKKGTKKKWQK